MAGQGKPFVLIVTIGTNATRTCKPVENYYSRRMAKMAAARNGRGDLPVSQDAQQRVCDWHASHYVKVMLDQIFGENILINSLGIECKRI